jgi:AraC-like DNA-binding protein
VFSYSYKYCDHKDYLQALGKNAGVPVVNNCIQLPPQIGTGYIKVREIAPGLQVLINECVTAVDVSFTREPVLHNSYTLRFDEVKNLKQFSLKIDEEEIMDDPMIYSGAFLSNSMFDLTYTANAGIEDRCINIYFTAHWLEENTGIKSTDEVFKKYFSLKTASLNFEILNLEYRSLMEDIFELDESRPMHGVTLQNRVMLLLEKFLRSLYTKLNTTEKSVNISEATLKQIIKVESILVGNLFVQPPTIPQLSRIAMMSETKLKNVFKAVYGYNIYEYYQKNRMLKARQLLRSKKMSVKETGIALGFKNLSNFTIAYKKEFNALPSEG